MQPPFFLARRFVAGETLETALPIVTSELRDGLHVALDLLGEDVEDPEQAAYYTEVYVALAERIAHLPRPDGTDLNISIKLSMMGQVIDHDLCERHLRRLLDTAKQHGVFVRLDMEGSSLTQSTLDLFEAVYPDYRDYVGVVLQAMLHRTARDVERMCELNARVRICKGAYKEPASLAHQDMPTIRAHYADYMRELIQHARYPGIATHDDQLIDATKAFVAEQGIDRDRFEFQMLYGLRPSTQRDLRAAGYHMRVYVPYGTQWFPYFSRRLRERKENVFFVLKALVKN
ncbi:MAG: proline dehydrogenase family protein [Bacteroidota bacterium]